MNKKAVALGIILQAIPHWNSFSFIETFSLKVLKIILLKFYRKEYVRRWLEGKYQITFCLFHRRVSFGLLGHQIISCYLPLFSKKYFPIQFSKFYNEICVKKCMDLEIYEAMIFVVILHEVSSLLIGENRKISFFFKFTWNNR